MRYKVAYLPAVQRDLAVARAVRRRHDPLQAANTQTLIWDDMSVHFEADCAVSPAIVEVEPSISIAKFTPRLESLLDCGDRSYKPRNEQEQWTIKFAAKISTYHSDHREVVRLICDRISSITDDETIGVMKIKRRGVKVGHARVRIVPSEDSLQVTARHQTSDGLKAVWKSVFWRLDPQFGEHKPKAPAKQKLPTGMTIVTGFCIWLPVPYSSKWWEVSKEASLYGAEVDLTQFQRSVDDRPKGLPAPIEGNKLKPFGHWSSRQFYAMTGEMVPMYYFSFKLTQLPPGGVPKWLSVDTKDGVPPTMVVKHGSYAIFYSRIKALSAWLDYPFYQELPVPPGHKDDQPPLGAE